MKKIIAILTALVLVVCMGTTAFAAEFTPSVVEKDAPTVVGKVEGGNSYAGTIVDKNGNEVEKIPYVELIVTPVSKVDTSTEIPAASKADLKEAYAALSKADVKLSDLIKELDDDVKASLGKDVTVDDLIIRDLFDASLVDNNGQLVTIDKDHRLVVTFDIGIEKGKAVFAMKYNEEKKWESIYAIHNNGDGTVTCEFDYLCPIAFLVEGEADSSDTGDTSVSLLVWAGIAVVSAALIVVLFVIKRKKDETAA